MIKKVTILINSNYHSVYIETTLNEIAKEYGVNAISLGYKSSSDDAFFVSSMVRIIL